MPKENSASPTRPAVTILCGFLGAGKTTLLNHLLSQAEGRRWAAVVNDMAAINIDAALVRKSVGGNRDIVELENGCVCCSNRDELAETLAELASTGDYEHILVETTGVAEPRGLANLFVQKNLFGRSLNDFAQLSSLVSVVDSAHFLREWHRYQQSPATARKRVHGTERPVFELMLEQVECADVLVLNKTDLLEDAARVELHAIIQGLNTRAEIVVTEQSQISSEFLLDRVRFDAKETLGAAQWIHALNTASAKKLPSADHRPSKETKPSAEIVHKKGETGLFVRTPLAASPALHAARYGITSFVYEGRRPFLREKFEAFLSREMPGLLRAKGFFWIKEQPDEMGFLSIAGETLRVDFLNYWWAALIENGKARRADLPPALEKIWVEPFGDRRQELVFIGVNLDETEISAALKACTE